MANPSDTPAIPSEALPNEATDPASIPDLDISDLKNLTPNLEEFQAIAREVINQRDSQQPSEVSNRGDSRPASQPVHAPTSRFSSKDHLAPSPERLGQGFGLKLKVTLAAVLLATLPTLAIGGVAYNRASNATRSQIFEAKTARAIALTRRMQIYMGFRVADIESLAARPDIRSLQNYTAEDITELQRTFDNYIAQYKVYDNVALFDLQGNPIAQSSGVKLDNIGQAEYFQQALDSGRTAYTPPVQSGETNEPVSFLAAPVKIRQTGETIGVIRLRLPEVSMFQAVSDINANGDTIYLVDREGQYILTAPGEENLIGTPLEENFQGITSQLQSNPDRAMFMQDADQQRWLVASSASRTEPGLFNPRWTGIVKTPEATALQTQAELLRSLQVGLALVTVLAAGLATLVASRATQPLLAASDAVKRIGEGDLDARLDVPEVGDELVQLGQNINRMGSQLKGFFASQEADAQQANLLGEIARLQSLEALAPPLGLFLQGIQQQRGGDRILFQRFNPDGHSTILAEAVLEDFLPVQGQSFPALSETQLANLVERQQPQAYDRLTPQDFPPELLIPLQTWQVKSLLWVPVFVNGQLYGLLSLHSCAQEHHWTEAEIEQLTQVANPLGLSLTAVESFIQTQNQAQQQQVQKENLQRDLLNLLSDVEGASSGDLTVRAQITDGEIGIVADFFNAIVENLRDIVTQVKQASSQVNDSVNSDGASILKLSTDSIEQAAQINLTLASIEEMTNSLQTVAQQATAAAQASQTAEATAQAGGRAMESTVASISQVRQTVADTAKQVKRLGESSQQISKVVELINQIALKTNLLAVNAGIEAARAGEEGRGFAVVAEEVGALATQSTLATKEIEQIIAAIQSETTNVVDAMETSTSQVVEGTRSVEEAKKSLEQILEVSRNVNSAFHLISSETTTQANISEQIKQMMAHVAQVSTETSHASRGVSDSLQATAEITEQLQRSVDAFNVDSAS